MNARNAAEWRRTVGEAALLVEEGEDAEGLVLEQVDAALIVLEGHPRPVDLLLDVLLLLVLCRYFATSARVRVCVCAW